MKRIYFIVLLLSFARMTAAQDTVRRPDPQGWSAGLLTGYTYNHHVVDMGYMNHMKYMGYIGNIYGLKATYAHTKWFAVRTEPALVQKNYIMLHYVSDVEDDGYFATQYNNNYIDVPLFVDLSTMGRVRLHLVFGGYAGWWLNGNRVGGTIALNSEGVEMFDENYEFNSVRDNRFDAGLIYGAGLSGFMGRKIEWEVGFRTYYGLTDIQKHYMMNQNPRYNTTYVLQFGIAYKLSNN